MNSSYFCDHLELFDASQLDSFDVNLIHSEYWLPIAVFIALLIIWKSWHWWARFKIGLYYFKLTSWQLDCDKRLAVWVKESSTSTNQCSRLKLFDQSQTGILTFLRVLTDCYWFWGTSVNSQHRVTDLTISHLILGIKDKLLLFMPVGWFTKKILLTADEPF